MEIKVISVAEKNQMIIDRIDNISRSLESLKSRVTKFPSQNTPSTLPLLRGMILNLERINKDLDNTSRIGII